MRKSGGLSIKSGAFHRGPGSGSASSITLLGSLLNNGLAIQLLFAERGFKNLDAPGSLNLFSGQDVRATNRSRVVKPAPLELAL